MLTINTEKFDQNFSAAVDFNLIAKIPRTARDFYLFIASF